MKKVGIITIHNSPNYGASLQSYALYKYIEQAGYDCEVIDLHRPCYDDFVPSKKYVPYRESKLKKLKQVLKKIIRRKDKFYSERAKIKFDAFNTQIKMSKPYCGIDELYANPPRYDIYISGSDQLWNPAQPYCLEPYFLTFAPRGSKKLAYATSIGITELADKEKSDFRNWLSSYDAISVRERQAKILLESFIGREVKQVLDPTFLLDIDYWKSLAVYPDLKQPYFLLFTLSYQPVILEYALRLSREAGIRLISLGQLQPDAKNGEYKTVKDAGPKEFIGYLANADMVITDSFHGTVFSIIMGSKNFYTYIAPGNKRGSRITDLLTLFGLKSHLLDTRLNCSYSELEKNKINREELLAVIAKEQTDSRSFLLDNIRE